MTSTPSLPNAFLPGVAKAGTTSLARYLGRHPDVYMPAKKEPNYYLFSQESPNDIGPAPAKIVHYLLHRFSVTDAAGFEKLYEPAGEAPIRLDASVRYLYHPVALEAIERVSSDARHIVVLRDAVERIVSHWRMNREFQLEPLGLADALAAEDERVESGWGWDWHYRRISTYEPQLRNLLDLFSRRQVLVLLYGDFVRSPDETLRSCFRFLQVDETITIDRCEREKVSSEPRSAVLERLLHWPNRSRRVLRALPRGERILEGLASANRRAPTPIHPSETNGLAERFSADTVALAKLMDLDAEDLVRRLRSTVAPATGPART